jgi:hypothetical protein
MEAWRLEMALRRVCRPMVEDLHYFDEKQEQDPDPHLSEKLDSDPR